MPNETCFLDLSPEGGVGPAALHSIPLLLWGIRRSCRSTCIEKANTKFDGFKMPVTGLEQHHIMHQAPLPPLRISCVTPVENVEGPLFLRLYQ